MWTEKAATRGQPDVAHPIDKQKDFEVQVDCRTREIGVVFSIS